METFFLDSQDIFKFYERINQDFCLYLPVLLEAVKEPRCDYGFSLPTHEYTIKKYSEIKKEEVVFNDYRSLEPTARCVFSHFKEELGGYFKPGMSNERPRAICGLKNCDIFSLKIQDYVFLDGVEEDQVYQERRRNTLIISSDCPVFKESCFCRAFDIDPFVKEGFDFNLSLISGGFLLDVNSSRAKTIAASLSDILKPATFGQLSGRDAKRQAVARRMEEHLEQHKIPKKESLRQIVTDGFNSQLWQEQMQTCVECAGCIFICDTCHCFLLVDEPQGEEARRLRIWDGCLLKNFSRVAGGANPLKLRSARLRNRYLKKFEFFIDNLGYQACCGCGRCIDVCPGKIDIRHILRKLYEEKYLPAS